MAWVQETKVLVPVLLGPQISHSTFPAPSFLSGNKKKKKNKGIIVVAVPLSQGPVFWRAYRACTVVSTSIPLCAPGSHMH